MSWGTRSRWLTSMGWRYSYLQTIREHPEIRVKIEVMKTKSWSTRVLLTPSSHLRKGRISRGRTLSTYLIGGSQNCVTRVTYSVDQLTQLLSSWESLEHLQYKLQWRSEEVVVWNCPLSTCVNPTRERHIPKKEWLLQSIIDYSYDETDNDLEID